jgi:hypothetical protein
MSSGGFEPPTLPESLDKALGLLGGRELCASRGLVDTIGWVDSCTFEINSRDKMKRGEITLHVLAWNRTTSSGCLTHY